jgi:hypothetical protein
MGLGSMIKGKGKSSNLFKPSLNKGLIDKITGKEQKGIADAQQRKQMNAALAEYNTYTDPKYNTMQQNIVKQQASGFAPTIDETSYSRTTENPLAEDYSGSVNPAMQKAVAGSLGGTAGRALSSQAEQNYGGVMGQARLNAQKAAEGMQNAALSNLQQAAAGRANIYQGQASQVQANPSALSTVSKVFGAYKNIRGATKK